MKTNKRFLVDIIIGELSRMLNVVSYLLLALYMISILFKVELNPSFPFHETELFLSSIAALLLSLLLKLWLFRND